MTSKERVKKWREKLKKNVELRNMYLQKERERAKKNRETEKQKLLEDPQKLKEKRRQTADRVRKWRENKKKEAQKKHIHSPHKIGSYKCPQSLGKAVNKVKKALPKSPSKQSAVVRKLVHDILPSGTQINKKIRTAQRNNENDMTKVAEFYTRDDVSHQAPGLRDTKSVKDPSTGKRTLVQKRHMIMTVKEAFNLFTQEYPEINIKISKFYELRPRYVLLSSLMPHNVCVCKYHANFNFVTQALHRKLKNYFPGSGREILNSVCCNSDSEPCMTGFCSKCKNIDSLLAADSSDILEEVITWKQWKDCEGRPKLVDIEGTIEDAVNELQVQLPTFKTHCFVKNVQSRAFEERKKNISSNHAIIQVDYAENFLIVTQDEIQAAHWSHDQISLFTCCVWMENSVIRSFVVVSENSHMINILFGLRLKKFFWN